MKEEFTLSIYTEDVVGALNKVSLIFSRRHINIMSITASTSEVEDIHRYTIVINETEEQVKKLVGQIEKQVDIAKAFYYRNSEVVYQEMALYKLRTESFTQGNVEFVVRRHGANILDVTPEYVIIQKSGWGDEIEALSKELNDNFEVLEYTNSGRVAISKNMTLLQTYIDNLEKNILI
ncbi:acetolactate synthase small subunit [Ornithobacterium rhinotracheale]